MASALGHANSSSEEDQALARHAALQGASSVEELIAMIPSDYRPVLREPLLKVASLTGKLVSTRRVLAGHVRHQTAGTYPAALSHKAPAIQLTAEYSSSAEAAAHRKSQEDAREVYLKTLLENTIRMKKDEVMFLQMSLAPEAAFKQLAPVVSAQTTAIMARTKVPIFGPEQEGGPPVLKSWADNVSAQILGTQVLNDCVHYSFRVQSIVEAREFSRESKVTAKKEIAKQADVEMADGTRPGPSIQSLIDKAVSARLKDLAKAPVKNTKQSKDGKKKKSPPAAKPKNPPKRYPSPPPRYLPAGGLRVPRIVKRKPTDSKKPSGSKQGKGKGK
ncbi:hypothetical protein CPB85DRAFT_1441042 [Mucidula mucida]|nr:hypothetical protein CPB85DRAFT_1441042 [Mucidula mucida]